MNYVERKNCIFCNTLLSDKVLENDLLNYNAHYPVDMDFDSFQEIPYNIYICSKCKTLQNTYLGDLNELYKHNHADSTGTLMKGLHELTLETILSVKQDINNILEIGSSVGYLSDLVLSKLNTKYYIIEPTYLGDTSNKVIINDFYENVDDSKINADTLIMSHVFEHFYKPLDIIKKIYDNKNIKNIFLIFPDLEYYINNDILHVLNSEHTYYVDNGFLIDVFKNYNFDLINFKSYKNHSVIFHFKRSCDIKPPKIDSSICNKKYDIIKYIDNIKNRVNFINSYMDKNSERNFYIWPASVHSLHLCMFGLNYKKLTGFLDNSKNKIHKKTYGYNIPIYDFNKKIEDNNKNDSIFINGGVFNQEVESKLKDIHFL